MEEIPTTSDPSMPGTTGPETGGSGTEGMTDATTTSDTSVTTGAPACMDPMEGAPNNTECGDASGCGCESGKCFVVPILGGWCGECMEDADCAPGGCTVPNPIDGVGATCNQGEPGAGCESDAVCTDPNNLKCGTLLAVENIIEVATCGECASNADCTDPMKPNCSPTYDVMNFSGKFVCVENASVKNGEGCNLADEGKGPGRQRGLRVGLLRRGQRDGPAQGRRVRRVQQQRRLHGARSPQDEVQRAAGRPRRGRAGRRDLLVGAADRS
jgi:hypothetical protein